MRFDGFVRGVLPRLAAALLVVLLAWLDAAPASLSVARERAASSAHSDGIVPTPTHAASAELAIAPAGAAPPAASAVQRVLVSFHRLVCRTITDSPSRLPVAVKPAPTVLRV
jgi:hypothetical protein